MDSKPSATTTMAPFEVPMQVFDSNVASMPSTSTLNVASATTNTAQVASALTILAEPIPGKDSCLSSTILKGKTIVVGDGVCHHQAKVMIANFGGENKTYVTDNTGAVTKDTTTSCLSSLFILTPSTPPSLRLSCCVRGSFTPFI